MMLELRERPENERLLHAPAWNRVPGKKKMHFPRNALRCERPSCFPQSYWEICAPPVPPCPPLCPTDIPPRGLYRLASLLDCPPSPHLCLSTTSRSEGRPTICRPPRLAGCAPPPPRCCSPRGPSPWGCCCCPPPPPQSAWPPAPPAPPPACPRSWRTGRRWRRRRPGCVLGRRGGGCLQPQLEGTHLLGGGGSSGPQPNFLTSDQDPLSPRRSPRRRCKNVSSLFHALKRTHVYSNAASHPPIFLGFPLSFLAVLMDRRSARPCIPNAPFRTTDFWSCQVDKSRMGSG